MVRLWEAIAVDSTTYRIQETADPAIIARNPPETVMGNGLISWDIRCISNPDVVPKHIMQLIWLPSQGSLDDSLSLITLKREDVTTIAEKP